MKHYLFLLFLLFPLLSFAQNDPYKNIKYEQLDNGLKVYLLSDKLAETTQVVVSVATGMDVETKQNSGIAHLTEHIIFRDQRIPHKDYLDYIKEEGATYINGQTGRYTTEYFATIDSDKSYWLVDIFSQMLFDKQVTEEDLEIEKRALQTEIGELQGFEKYTNIISELFTSIGTLFPDTSDSYHNNFSIKKEKDIASQYYFKKNNYDFTLKEVMKFYDKYYYPKNMTLKVAGNFDDKEMMSLIKKKYGSITKKGTKKAEELEYDAVLNQKPYRFLNTGTATKNYAIVGTKFILDDYKEYLILSAYSKNLASKMQQLLRNKLGQTYSVSQYYSRVRNASTIGVSFSSLHDEFQSNLVEVQKKIKQDQKKIPTSEIQEALKTSSLYYTTLEHNSGTLLNLISAQEYLHTHQNIYDKTPYEIFKSISTKDFQQVISNSFLPENSYEVLSYDYYFFPYDFMILLLISIVLIFIIYFKAHKLFFVKKDKLYTIRDIKFSRRLSNRFFSFLFFIILFLIAVFISDWSEYLFSLLIFDNIYYFETLEPLKFYIYYICSSILLYIIFILLLTTIFKNYFVRIDVTKERLNLVGGAIKHIDKDEIVDIQVEPFCLKNFIHTAGWSFLFYKPLVKILLNDNKHIYLRASNAKELKSDLLEWKNEI